jgi:hypothetical protein
MKRLIEFVRTLELTVLSVVLLSSSAIVVGQQLPPTVTHPSTSNVQVSPQREPSPYGSAANTATGMKRALGAITGFVYWQMNVLQPQADCQGLTVKVVTVSKSGMPLQLLSTTSTLTASGPMTDNSAQATPKYMLCSYSFQDMPENVSLRALLYGQPTTASVAIPSAFQIPGGNCNSGPSSTLSFILTGGPMLCGHGAYNINFKLTSAAAAAPRPTAPSILLPHAPSSGGMLSQPQTAPANATPAAPNQGGATLLPANPSSAPGNASNTPASNGMLAPTVKSGGAASIGGSGGFTGGVKPGTAPPRNPLSNADVIRMQKAGISESVIVHSIQSSTKQFDFSSTSLQALRQAHVSPKVLAAMCDGSAPACPQTVGTAETATPASKVELNPQPFPPRTAANPGADASLNSQPLLPGAGVGYVPKMPPMTSNPKRDASPVADAATKAEIKSKLEAQLAASSRRSASPQKVTPKPEQSDSPEVQALQKQRIFFESLRSQPSTAKDRLVSARAPNLALRPGQSPADPKLIAAPPQSKLCLTAQIHSVNGATSNVTFTQDPADNDYIISGCDFGSQEGKVYLSGAVSGGQINLVVKQWTDTQIEAVVHPGLTGVLDGWPDLIVAPPSGSPAKFPNCRFYAQRQSVILPSIPQQYATLANVTVGDSKHGFGTMYCPGPGVNHLFPCVAYNAGPPVDGITNGHDHRNDPSQQVSNAVDRDGGQLEFNSGEDVYDLSSMAPGFEVDYPNVFWYAWTEDVCEGWASDAFPKKPGDSVGYDTEGHYAFFKKTKTKVVVDWGVDHCAWRWLGVFRVDDWYNSGYSLQVYVKGPIGIDPWTGHSVNNSTRLGETLPASLVRMQ